MECRLKAKKCGGCPMLGLDYAEQLKQKEAAVRKLVGKYGPVAPIRGAENPCHYRNKVISTFAAGPGGKLVSGIYAAGTHKVLPVESCLLQDEVLDTVMQAVRAAASTCRYQPYNEDKGTGLLRHCLLRRGVVSGQVMVVLVTAQPVLPGAKNFVRALLAEAEKRHVPVTTVVQNYNPRRTSVVLGEEEKVLYGKGFILDTLCGKTYALSPRSFYQINHDQTEVLYGLAVEAARLTGKEVVLDAYCGIGTIGLTASGRVKQVVGVELNRDAVRDAIGNARHNDVKNARFFAADATQWITEAAAAGQRADVIFMDPPREGSTPQFIESVARMAPKRIVYVSCNPATAARDAAWQAVASRFNVEITSSIPNNMEINAPGVTKGSGLKTLADTLGLAMNQVMACGDSGNDLAMIQAAGYGIAMGNATPDVLAAARYVTDDNNHDGVAKAIETYVLKG